MSFCSPVMQINILKAVMWNLLANLFSRELLWFLEGPGLITEAFLVVYFLIAPLEIMAFFYFVELAQFKTW